jgi:hypothetical protein
MQPAALHNGEHPGGGYYRFDNVAWSAFLVLQGLTVDGWNEVCYLLMDALGWPVLLWYSLIVFCGAFFVMQLLSAVIVTSLQTCSAEAQLSDQLEAEREKRRSATAAQHLADGVVDDAGKPGGADAAALNAMGRFWESPAMDPVRRATRLHIPKLYELAESDGFNNFILACIAVNTVNMMCRHFPESDDFEFAQEIINYIFTTVFIAEFVIKHMGYGLAGYWGVAWNRLDGVVVISSIFDLAGSAVNLGFLRALRVLRVVRTVRVLKVAPEAMAVMSSMIIALGSMGGFLLVWLIFMLIYALLGTRMFGGACIFETDPDAGRLSFNSFARAMLTLFVTASGEDGFDVMHWTMQVSGVPASFFMISWMFISQIILSLLLALLIDTYSGEDEDAEEGEEGVHGALHGKNVELEIQQGILDMEDEEEAFAGERGSEGSLSRAGSHAGRYSDAGRSSRGVAKSFNAYVAAQHGGTPSSTDYLKMQRNLEKVLTTKAAAAPHDGATQRRYKKRLDLLQGLQRHRTMQECAVIRQWLYDIEFDTERLVANALPLPIRMTADQEQKAKDRLSIKKHYDRNKAANVADKSLQAIAFDPLAPQLLANGTNSGKSLKMESSKKSLAHHSTKGNNLKNGLGGAVQFESSWPIA